MTTELTVAKNGAWSLKEGKLFDVTHLPCRSALYTPGGGTCTRPSEPEGLPVTPGAAMPDVTGARTGRRALRPGGGRQGREVVINRR